MGFPFRRGTHRGLSISLLAVIAVASGAVPWATAATSPTCPQTSSSTTQATTVLQGFADASNAGVIYDSATTTLRLKKAGGAFKSTTLGVTDIFNIAAAADYDEDGWTDMVVASSEDKFIRFYKNRTYENAAPDWSDSTKIRAPKFVRTKDIEVASASASARAGMATGDFDNDGHADFFYVFSAPTSGGNYHKTVDIQKIYLGKGDGTFPTEYNAVASAASLGYLIWAGTNVAVFDYNKDGWPDIVYGTKTGTTDATGAVLVLVNGCATKWKVGVKCATSPTFTATTIKSGLNFGAVGINALAVADFTGDGISDLVLGSPSLCGSSSQPVRLFPGLSGGGFDTSYQGISTSGAATVMLAADFSLDGKIDLVYGSDNWNCGTSLGGNSYFLRNDGDNQPFSGGNTSQLSSHQAEVAGNLYDFDLGVTIDYDHDPDGTPDFIIADGNHSGAFFVFANRVVSTYVDCGEVASGILDLGALSPTEMVVTGARITPVQSVSTGSITYQMSNEEPPNWQVAAACTDKLTDYCATFPKPVGRYVRWKAVMCSNSTHNATPNITSIAIKFDYTPAKEHYRGGVIVSDGVSYVGAFRQPGDRGHFYAINAALNTKYWDFSTKLDAMSDSARNLYTATTDGLTRLDFTSAASSDARLQATLGAGSQTQADAIVTWARSERFGYGSSTLDTTRLGAVETSTPAIMTPPALPSWYVHAKPVDRTAFDQFMATYAKRPQLIFFGSKDGVFHAVRTVPTDISGTESGREIWGFIPAKVAFGFAADRAASLATSYPDGSPSLADVKINGALRTVAVVNGGNGSQGVFALDVTSTYATADPNNVKSVTTTVSGPTPLWHALPGSSLAGQSFAKTAVARVKIANAERYLAIMASGRASDNPSAPWTKGREVIAVDVATGAVVWQFTTKCPVTSDVLIFETDDDAEPGSPDVDGYADRAVVADYCGYVYKIALDSAPASQRITGLGAINTGVKDAASNNIMALFSVATTAGGLGTDRPIGGTIAARIDKSGRMILYFGTGGDEQYDVTKQNAFYAVYADTGAIRSKLLGTCVSSRCEKFYGGVVVTSDQVFMSKATDPPVGTTACDYGTSALVSLGLEDAAGTFTTGFTKALTSTTQSSLFGDAGALYLATLSGDIVRVGTPRAANAGGDSAAGNPPGGADGAGTVPTPLDPVTLMGWRQMF